MKLATFVAATVMALTGAGVVAQHVTFDFDRNADFSAYRAFGSGYGFPAARSGTARAEQVLVGTLVVTMVDATTERLVWRSAEKMFSHYPPK